jgi:3-hydroxyisobutyrate dehydrogenase
MANIAFIGLGIMGLPMAEHLVAAGHSARVHSRTKSKANSLIARGATWCDTASDAASGSDFVFICVTDTPDVEQVIAGEHGLMHSIRAGQIIIDHSTISPIVTAHLADSVAKSGAQLLDAPVSGGDIGARNATLSIMVGGDAAAFEKTLPLFRAMGKTITYCGKSGNGQLTKMVNQILVAGTLLAVAEAVVFAQKSGLNVSSALEAVGGGAAASWQLQNLGPKMVAGDFRPGFMIDLIQKDLRIVMDSADHFGTSLPNSALVHQLFTAAQAAGHGREGTQAIFTVLQKLASLH